MSKIWGFAGRHKVLVTLFIVVVAVVAWWNYEFPSATWRYKMTVTVETPEGIKTGSAVREVHVRTEPETLPDAATIHFSVKGEAVTIDMGHGKFLFAIMDTEGSPKIVSAAFPYSEKDDADYVLHNKELRGATTLSPSLYPMFVTFKDIKDPKSVELVYGGRFDSATQTVIPVNDFEKFFGKGVKIKDITIEMTDEPVTWGIETYLGWLPARKNIPGSIGGSPDKPFEDPSGTFLTGVGFSKGRYW